MLKKSIMVSAFTMIGSSAVIAGPSSEMPQPPYRASGRTTEINSLPIIAACSQPIGTEKAVIMAGRKLIEGRSAFTTPEVASEEWQAIAPGLTVFSLRETGIRPEISVKMQITSACPVSERKWLSNKMR